MRLADARQEAFAQAMARLDPQQQKELLADQNGWVRSYARTRCTRRTSVRLRYSAPKIVLLRWPMHRDGGACGGNSGGRRH
jgi:hypothetical protein